MIATNRVETGRKQIWAWSLAWFSLLLLLGGCSPVNSAAVESPLLLPTGAEARPARPNGPPLGPSLGVRAPNRPQRIALPSIGVDTDVETVGWYSVTLANGQTASQWEVADFAAGWHKNSAVPGQPGNIVISGHNNIQGAVFRKLYRLQPGDIARLWADGQEFNYRVEEVMILEETGTSMEQQRENGKWIASFDHERLTLVSCWPETSNTHRVVVVAKPVHR